MEYKVLYRKYRPTSFDEVIGQTSVIETLKNSITQNKIAHAYIFSGIRGTGKTSIAKIFAKAINCINNNDGNPCNKCNNCLSFNNVSDIIEIDAASNNGVDEIREIVNNSRLMPNVYKYKVYIIDEVHMLSIGAFNALLKTLEEPLDHVVFILATTDIQKVPVTILSRCQKYDFNRISIDDMVNHLKNICDKENIIIEEEALKEIAFLSDGAVRDALSILERFSKNDHLVTVSEIENQIGIVSTEKIIHLIELINNRNSEDIIQLFNTFQEKNYDINLIIKKIIDELSKVFKTNSILRKVLKDINDNYYEIMTSFNSYLNLEIKILDNIATDDENHSSPIVVEPKKKNDLSQTKVCSDVEELETESISINYNHKNIDKVFAVRINNCFVNANKELLIQNKVLWKKKLKELEMADINIYSIIAESQPVMCSQNVIVIVLPTNSEVTLIKSKYEIVISKMNINDLKISFISCEEWNDLKKKYIEDIKNKVIYYEQEEPELLKDDSEQSFSNSAKELFGNETVDII